MSPPPIESPEDTVIRELLVALDFYARNIFRRKSSGEMAIQTPIEHDCGDKARAALAKHKGGWLK